MTTFWIAFAAMPLGSLLIAWAYVAQYRTGSVSRTLLVAVHAASIALIVLSYFKLVWDFRIDTTWQYPGWAVFAIGSAIFWHAAFVHKASLVPQQDYRVFSGGPYRFIRHPIYAGGVLGAAGLILVAPAWQVVAVWLVLFVSLWVLLTIEEHELHYRYGDSYDQFCRRTKRLIPFVL